MKSRQNKEDSQLLKSRVNIHAVTNAQRYYLSGSEGS